MTPAATTSRRRRTPGSPPSRTTPGETGAARAGNPGPLRRDPDRLGPGGPEQPGGRGRAEQHTPTSTTTLIDARAETAARAAVAMHATAARWSPSSRPPARSWPSPTTPAIPTSRFTAQVAPGSTMKVITSAALISSGVLTASLSGRLPSRRIRCRASPTTTTTANPSRRRPRCFTDFAQSCNNAFSTQWPHLSGGGLARAAKEYFGLNQDWNIGITGLGGQLLPCSGRGQRLRAGSGSLR